MRYTPFHWHKYCVLGLIWLFSGFLLKAQNNQSEDLGEKYYSIFLIGDAGEINETSLQNFKSLKLQMRSAGQMSTTLFLGDNIYPLGMPDEEDDSRSQAEEILKSQLDLVIDYKGQAIMVPGNHDWQKGGRDGMQSLLHAEDFSTTYLNERKFIYPGNACPGPSTFELTEDILLVVYDSQWILHKHDRPGENESCPAKTGLELFAQLQEIVKLNGHKKIILAAHHPIYSYGMHGGKSNFRHHVFPLTDAQKSLYLPLPIVGSIYPLYRKFLGNVQDVSHPLYKVMKKSIRELVEMYPNIIHASGHEHSLQYITRKNAHYIVSGSGSKTAFVKDGKYSEYTAELIGYSRLDFYSSGAVKMVFVSQTDGQDETVFEKELFRKAIMPDPFQINDSERIDFSNQTVLTNVSDRYEAGKGKERWFGTNYRDVWKTKVELPVFDIGQEHGGLEIVQRGGGFQTKSLRLEAQDGKQYVLRSIEKYTNKAIPEILRGSFAADVVQDQISASHPYGAFVVPFLAENAGIYHTNPKPVLVPNDPRFGKYREEFANKVVLYEERPSRNWEDASHFGNSKEIINTTKLIKSLKKDNDNYVDQNFVLRNRLFDLFIADWDRHEDQWRWAVFKEKKGNMYRPIPRDRDQAFFLNQGILPKIASRKWAMPKFQGFDFDLKNVPGFMFNARYFDRSFLNEPSKEEWIKVAEDLRLKLNNDAIESALSQWPDSVYQKGGELVGLKLQSRREELTDWALDYYSYLSKEVDVVGSDKQEYFDIERVSNGDTKVTVYKINKKGIKKKELYSRQFVKGETKEIRLYGLGGKDRFNIHGKANSAIRTRIIGGKGKDSIVDLSSIRGWGRSTLIYDTKKGSYIEKGKESRDFTSSRTGVNEYNRKAFKYNVTLPLLIGNYNVDDGVFIGGGLLRTTFGFRKDPYKNRHLFLGMAAIRTGSFDFRYKGIYNRVIGSLDITADIDVEGPNYTMNYFGMGNESTYNQNLDIDFYRVRFDNILADFYLRKRITEDFKISLGPKYENINVRENSTRFLSQEATNPDTVFQSQRYFGPSLKIELDTRDNEIMPLKGLHLQLEGKVLGGINGFSNDYGNLTGSFAFYWSFREPAAITISNRMGGGHTDGDFEFYQSNTLGGSGKTANLRGYRRTRFYGETSFYNNAEIRFKLFGFRTYLFPSHFGILVFHDIGRVWLEGEESNKWHQSIGGGIWMSPFESMILSAVIADGEETLLVFKFGFLF